MTADDAIIIGSVRGGDDNYQRKLHKLLRPDKL